MSTYYINKNTKIDTSNLENNMLTTPVKLAIKRFYRDMEHTLCNSSELGMNLVLSTEEGEAESFQIYGELDNSIMVKASDALGFIYALNYISENALGVTPFWFWNDQVFTKKSSATVLTDREKITSKKAKVKYRGWFINDEVLLSTWKVEGSLSYAWEMAMEALLRLGGNMVIPGTDSNSKTYRKLASDMGLWITHHHAEPLGAEMFARAYPHRNPSYDEHPDLFQKLWRDGIEGQLEDKVIWNLGFRGQGDLPFWKNDPKYATPKQRGELISSLIKLQYQMVCERVKDPVCCTNLYGEIMELYQEGMLDLPEGIIKVWADNGYGKMVSRRQGNNNPRVCSLPSKDKKESEGFTHGIYYHVSFYDLQAANHMTMFPNSMEFVGNELENAFHSGVNEFLIVNCSNIKPHVYPLDCISKLWMDGVIDAKEHRIQYVNRYYGTHVEEIAECFSEYAECMVPFGEQEDEHAGEQFYNYTVRQFAHHIMKGEMISSERISSEKISPVKGLLWLNLGDEKTLTISNQVSWFQSRMQEAKSKFQRLFAKCEAIVNDLSLIGINKNQPSESEISSDVSEDNAIETFSRDNSAETLVLDSIWLQVKFHLLCIEGSISFCDGFHCYEKGELKEAFFHMGLAAEKFQSANDNLRAREHGKWNGFYANDCLCDVKQTAYVLRHVMGYLRNLGDGPHFYKWQREVLYKEEDRRVVLITNMENHLTDEELFDCMKDKIGKKNGRNRGCYTEGIKQWGMNRR
ncbi:glycosyl hydrolase 115 family protein [Lachnoclostridium phytofermentans]|uniref:glycosyl hydrolase 115 family protein n=1 Tax=Lachnoclostridium phytofermentans TaxID=66219 RepID=UPI00068D1434|nr:glycosyl hydrolase 115 family protein [Lachnoclostridium phytofermentans]